MIIIRYGGYFMEKIIGFIVTAGHLDIEWYQPLRSYRFWTVEALEELKRIREKRTDFKTYCLDGQYFPLKEYLEVVPEDEAYFRDMVKEGILTIGPFFTQFDEWLPSAESMIRNCLFGERLCKGFGGYMRAGYLPDNFGHPRQMPQILKGFGIDSLLFMRGMPEVPGDHHDEFIYEGIDGTQIFASHFRESYSGAFDIFDKPVYPAQPREVPYYPDYLSYEQHRELAEHDDPERIAKSMIENVHKIKERYPSRIIPLIAGYDHLPPQAKIGESVAAANAMQDEIEFVMGDVEEYVKLAQENLNKNAPVQHYDMELIGSMYQYVLLGALSARTYLKRENFACEVLLEKYAEPLEAMASLYGYPYKKRLLREAWENMLIDSAHDSIHGSSVDEVHVEMRARFGAARQIAAGVIHDALKYIGKTMAPWAGKTEEILAMAPVTAKKQTVELYVPVGEPVSGGSFAGLSYDPAVTRHLVIVDEEGHVLPTQFLPPEPAERNGRGELRNNTWPVPVFEKVLFQDDFDAYRIKKYRVAEEKSLSDAQRLEEQAHIAAAEVRGDDRTLENERVKVEVVNGSLTITDKVTGKVFEGLNILEEEADAGDPWDYAHPWIPSPVIDSDAFVFESRLKELGQVRGVLEMNGTMKVPYELEGDVRSKKETEIPVTFTVTVTAGVPRVDVKCVLFNTAKDHRIRLRIPMQVETDTIRSQGQLCILDRSVKRQQEINPWRQPPTALLPMREWVTAEDAVCGLSVACKGMYDYEAVEMEDGKPYVYVTLLRSFDNMSRINTMQRDGDAAMAFYTPDAQCLGEQVMEWSYLPYAASGEEKAPFLADAESYIAPPVGHAIREEHVSCAACSADGSSAKTGEAVCGDICAAPFAISADNIVFSAFKIAYNEDGYILRFFENQGKTTELTLPIADCFGKVCLADMNEQETEELPVKDGAVKLTVDPYKAITLKLSRK